ncbi:MAG TPA: nucleotidyltransferase domain-containing protein [Candidatus Lokiarchaeia archaeon]|nr:nucleotidyltransferase domain-containing protein [Candidatus Lokiarchaeia archaeon]
MSDNRKITEHEIIPKTIPVFEMFGCDFVYLGGSVASGTNGWWSDIDFFVHAIHLDSEDKSSSFNWREKIEIALVKELHTDDIHVNILVDLPLNVQFSLISNGKVIYEKDDGTIRLDYIEHMLPKYYDFITWYSRMINEWVY